MTRSGFSAAALAVACLAAGCAAAPGEHADAGAGAGQLDCFNARMVNSFSEVDHSTVRVRVGANQYYDIGVTPTCRDLDWSNQLALTTRGRSTLCVGPSFGDGQIVTREDSCTITHISHAPGPRDADPQESGPAEGPG